MKILIIEDHRHIVEAITLAFQIRWPAAKIVSTDRGDKGIEMVEKENPDILILDLGLPDISGFDVLKQVRLFSDIPILILTARTEENDVVKGLEWGADDYVSKPFRQLELLSRVQALLRRRQTSQKETPVVLGQMSLNPVISELEYKDKKINLTVSESKVLYELMKNAGQVVTHTILAEALWGSDYPGASDTIKVYIRRLREKIEKDSSDPKFILTRPGVGYQMTRPEG